MQFILSIWMPQLSWRNNIGRGVALLQVFVLIAPLLGRVSEAALAWAVSSEDERNAPKQPTALTGGPLVCHCRATICQGEGSLRRQVGRQASKSRREPRKCKGDWGSNQRASGRHVSPPVGASGDTWSPVLLGPSSRHKQMFPGILLSCLSSNCAGRRREGSSLSRANELWRRSWEEMQSLFSLSGSAGC